MLERSGHEVEGTGNSIHPHRAQGVPFFLIVFETGCPGTDYIVKLGLELWVALSTGITDVCHHTWLAFRLLSTLHPLSMNPCGRDRRRKMFPGWWLTFLGGDISCGCRLYCSCYKMAAPARGPPCSLYQMNIATKDMSDTGTHSVCP